MAAKPQVAVVGAGRWGSTLAAAVAGAAYRVSEIVPGKSRQSRRRAQELARRLGARVADSSDVLTADLIWICVPDREIARAAGQLARVLAPQNKIIFHSSGALPSQQLRVLRQAGAAVASVHPLMTFVHDVNASLKGVPFAVEGDARATRLARRIVRHLGGKSFSVAPRSKISYHAWCGFLSPLLIELLVSAEAVARHAGLSRPAARTMALPILRQTLANYARLGPAASFSGPLVRGDTEVMREHLRALKQIPAAREVYLALARAGLQYLPVGSRKEMERILRVRKSRSS